MCAHLHQHPHPHPHPRPQMHSTPPHLFHAAGTAPTRAATLGAGRPSRVPSSSSLDLTAPGSSSMSLGMAVMSEMREASSRGPPGAAAVPACCCWPWAWAWSGAAAAADEAAAGACRASHRAASFSAAASMLGLLPGGWTSRGYGGSWAGAGRQEVRKKAARHAHEAQHKHCMHNPRPRSACYPLGVHSLSAARQRRLLLLALLLLVLQAENAGLRCSGAWKLQGTPAGAALAGINCDVATTFGSSDRLLVAR